VAAALIESLICGLKLGDRTSLTGVLRERAAGIRPPRSSGAAAPLVSWGGCRATFAVSSSSAPCLVNWDVRKKETDIRLGHPSGIKGCPPSDLRLKSRRSEGFGAQGSSWANLVEPRELLLHVQAYGADAVFPRGSDRVGVVNLPMRWGSHPGVR